MITGTWRSESVRLDRGERLVAVHLGHDHVEKHDTHRAAQVTQRDERRLAVVRLVRVDPDRGEVALEQLPVDGAVVDDQGDVRHGIKPATASSLTVSSHAERAAATRSARPVASPSRPANSISRAICARRIAPSAALLDLRVCAGRTTAPASRAATAASIAAK